MINVQNEQKAKIMYLGIKLGKDCYNNIYYKYNNYIYKQSFNNFELTYIGIFISYVKYTDDISNYKINLDTGILIYSKTNNW